MSQDEFSLSALLDDETDGARDGLVFEGERLRWSEVATRALRLGAKIERANGGRARRVALRASNRLETALALYAMFDRGITVVPLHPRLTDAEAAALADDAECALRLDDASLDALIRSDEAPLDPRWTHEIKIDPEAPLAVLYTSGTTGRPKGAVLSRRAFVASARASEVNLPWSARDRWLLCLPLCHVGGLSVLTRCLFARQGVVLQRKFDERAVLDAIEREGVTIASFVPTMMHRLLEADSRGALAALRAALLGGAATSTALLRACAERSIHARTTYGLTEACSQVSTQGERDWSTVELGSGAPLAATELCALREDGTRCEHDEVGALVLRGPTLFSGYLHHEPRARESWFSTGDFGFFDERGRLHVVARRTDLIVTGGENVYPLEVERALDGIEGVRASLVFGVDDPRWGQVVACALVIDERFCPDRFAVKCAEMLAPHKRPRLFAPCEALPLTAANKPDRRAARERFSSQLEPVRYRASPNR
ncbi:MAG: class I adenylate-forming enzyme family protein [Polyangiales bacterium]